MATKKKVIQGGLDVQKSDGTSALTVNETTGAVTAGPPTANVTHTQLAAKQTVYRKYTGGSSRSLSTAPTSYISEQVWIDEFTDLSTAAWDVAGGTSLSSSLLMCWLTNVSGDICCFCVSTALDAGSAHNSTAFGAANCSIAESPEGVFAITGMGDGITYTLTVTTGGANLTLKASSTQTGTTRLFIKRHTFIA